MNVEYSSNDLLDYRKESKNRSFVMTQYESIKEVTIKPHYHNSIEIIYVLKGKIKIHTDGIEYNLEDSDIIYINSGRMHSINYFSNTRIISLKISSIWLNKIIPNFINTEINFCSINIKNPPMKQVCEDIINKFLLLNDIFYLNSDFSDIGVNGYIFLLLYELISNFKVNDNISSKSNYKYQDRIKYMVKYLNNHYQENISLKEISLTLGVTPQYLSKLFHTYYSMNYKKYLNKLRLEHSIYEITTTNDSFLDISMKCGFSSQHSFIDAFKKQYNMTPKEYRMLHNNHKLLHTRIE